MNHTSKGFASAARLRFSRVAAFVLLTGVVAAAAAVGVQAHGGSGAGIGFGWHHGAGHGEDAAAHAERFLQHVYIEIDATDAQKARLEPIFRQAAADLSPLKQRFRDGHTQLHALLGNDTIDRAAVESIRAQQVAMADQASRVLTSAVLDATEVLTPAQRKTLLDRVRRHHGGKDG